jgi:hypothetical protein
MTNSNSLMALAPLVEAVIGLLLLVFILAQVGRIVKALLDAAHALVDLAHWQKETARQLNALVRIWAAQGGGEAQS